LRAYEDNIYTRGVLLRIPFVALEQIEDNSWWDMKFSDDEKVQLRSIIRVDIVSKIMMYIEMLLLKVGLVPISVLKVGSHLTIKQGKL
jgi:hypothetical protein